MPSRLVSMNMKKRISLVKESLKSSPDADLNDLVWEIVNKFGCCARTAKEYIKTAKWSLKNADN